MGAAAVLAVRLDRAKHISSRHGHAEYTLSGYDAGRPQDLVRELKDGGDLTLILWRVFVLAQRGAGQSRAPK